MTKDLGSQCRPERQPPSQEWVTRDPRPRGPSPQHPNRTWGQQPGTTQEAPEPTPRVSGLGHRPHRRRRPRANSNSQECPQRDNATWNTGTYENKTTQRRGATGTQQDRRRMSPNMAETWGVGASSRPNGRHKKGARKYKRVRGTAVCPAPRNIGPQTTPMLCQAPCGLQGTPTMLQEEEGTVLRPQCQADIISSASQPARDKGPLTHGPNAPPHLEEPEGPRGHASPGQMLGGGGVLCTHPLLPAKSLLPRWPMRA